MFLVFCMILVIFVASFDLPIELVKMVFHGGSSGVFLKQLNLLVVFLFWKVKCITFSAGGCGIFNLGMVVSFAVTLVYFLH